MSNQTSGSFAIHRREEVSVIIPARDEERNIERVVRSVAAQEPVKEILVADDQSQDATPEILARLQREVPLVRVVRVTAVPEGWSGKVNAMETAARFASGTWLLFTDADTEHISGSLEFFLQRAENQGADLLSLSPGQRTPTWWEKCIIPQVFTQLAKLFPYEMVTDPQSPVVAANGQYMLIRRTAYDRVGGYAAVRSAILDDVELARRIKSSGGRIVFELGTPRVWTRMYDRFAAMWEGWTKGLFLLYGSSTLRVLRAIGELSVPLVVPCIFGAAAIAMLVKQYITSALLLAILAVVASAASRHFYARSLSRAGFDARLANFQIPGTALLVCLLINSVIAHRILRKVKWKGRQYSAEKKR